jgi:hypothetical protein
MKTVPGEYHRMAKSGKPKEPDGVHKISPISGFKGFGK